MVKHAQTIRCRLSTNYFIVFDHFVGLVLKGFSYKCANLTKFNTLMHNFPKCSGTPLKFWGICYKISKVCLGILRRYALQS